MSYRTKLKDSSSRRLSFKSKNSFIMSSTGLHLNEVRQVYKELHKPKDFYDKIVESKEKSK